MLSVLPTPVRFDPSPTNDVAVMTPVVKTCSAIATPIVDIPPDLTDILSDRRFVVVIPVMVAIPPTCCNSKFWTKI